MKPRKWICAFALVALATGLLSVVNSNPGKGQKEASEDGARVVRKERRAFYTAPPVIPHGVDHRTTDKTCLTCHQNVVTRQGKASVMAPHPQFYNCQQCHVRSVSAEHPEPIEVPTNWVGLEEPTAGLRTQPKAPPMIPHREFLRENCLTCHSPKSPHQHLRTSHPDRSNCKQCHVSDASLQF
jgi:nitrate reductase (cytochrome), electron transfer subunit